MKKNYKMLNVFAKKIVVFALVFCLALPLVAVPKSSTKANKNAQNDANGNETSFDSAQFLEKLQSTVSANGAAAGVALFDEVPEEFAQEKDLKYLKASLLLSAGRAKEAEPLAEQLMNTDAKNTQYIFLAAMIAKAQVQLNKKTDLLKKIIAIDPNNAEANAELGNEKMLAKGYKDAKKYFLKSMTASPTYITAIFGYGHACYYLGELKEARSAFEKVLAINPKEDIAWSYLAKVDAETELYRDAIENIKKAIECNATYYNYWIDLGDYNRLWGKYAEAVDAYTKAIEIDPSYFLAYVYRASSYEALENNVSALADYKMVAKTNPNYQYAYESIGILAWIEGDYEVCRQAFEKAYSLNKDNISYPLMISLCYQKQGKRNDNRNFLAKAMRNLDKSSGEYAVMRLYYDAIGDGNVLRKVHGLESKTLKGKLLYYMGAFYEVNTADESAKNVYLEIKQMNTPMFFEYRLALNSLDVLEAKLAKQES